MKDLDYILVSAPMRKHLGLKGNELLLFALIFGFCKANNQVFYGSLSYAAEWIGLTKRAVQNLLSSLLEKGLIARSETYDERGLKVNYTVTDYAFTTMENFSIPTKKEAYPDEKSSWGDGKNFVGGMKNLRGGIEKTSTNNTIDNIEYNTSDNKKEEIYKEEKSGTVVPTYLKLENGKIADLSAAGALLDVFTEWLQYKHERRERYKSQRSIDIKLRELREWSGNDPEVARQIVERSIGNNYAGLFNPNESSRKAQGQGHETARAQEDADPDFDRHYEELKEQVRQREYNQRFGR